MEFGAYVFTIAKRQCLDFLKRASVEQTAMGLILQNYSPNLTVLEDNQQFRDYMAFIEKVLTTLPEQPRLYSAFAGSNIKPMMEQPNSYAFPAIPSRNTWSAP
jgi:hypothetical protein